MPGIPDSAPPIFGHQPAGETGETWITGQVLLRHGCVSRSRRGSRPSGACWRRCPSSLTPARSGQEARWKRSARAVPSRLAFALRRHAGSVDIKIAAQRDGADRRALVAAPKMPRENCRRSPPAKTNPATAADGRAPRRGWQIARPPARRVEGEPPSKHVVARHHGAMPSSRHALQPRAAACPAYRRRGFVGRHLAPAWQTPPNR